MSGESKTEEPLTFNNELQTAQHVATEVQEDLALRRRALTRFCSVEIGGTRYRPSSWLRVIHAREQPSCSCLYKRMMITTEYKIDIYLRVSCATN